MEPILRGSNRTLTDWTVLMITFMITYEIRMNCQVTLIALIFFQNRSKYSTVKLNKDVLIDQIGGLSSALALHSINCDVKVFEKSSGEKSRGRSCSANGTC
jgi:hypothetical protein